jgi:solute carrier family 45 protein 1/2/4
MALVWLAGPLAGVIGQPYFGLCSDQCRISWGKRKPFIAAGALVTILSLLALAWAHDIAYGMTWTVGLSQDGGVLRTTTLTVAALCVWVLNFAIQPLQGGLRALIIDCCPPKDMDTAFAWAGRMVSVGNVLGYGSGFVDFSRFVKSTSDTQFEALAVLATCGLAITTGLCCFWVLEQNPNDDGPPRRDLVSLMGKIKYTYNSVSRLPPQVKMVFKVQFCSWLGWFSFLYYITT